MFNFKGEVISLFDNSIKQDIVKNKKKSTLVSSADLLRNHNSLFASLRLKKKKAGKKGEKQQGAIQHEGGQALVETLLLALSPIIPLPFP